MEYSFFKEKPAKFYRRTYPYPCRNHLLFSCGCKNPHILKYLLFPLFPFLIPTGGTAEGKFEKAGKVTGVKKSPFKSGILHGHAGVENIIRGTIQAVLKFVCRKSLMEKLFEKYTESAGTQIAQLCRLFRSGNTFTAVDAVQCRQYF